MFVAMTIKGERVTLVDHQQAEALRHEEFVCPACRQPVRIKNGQVMPAHFAHIGPACDVDSEGESTIHLKGKQWLAKLGERLGYQVTLEVYYPQIKQRADVVWVKDKRTLILEFQCSPLDPKRLKVRTQGYQQLGLEVIWILGPRYYSKRPGAMQARFLRWDQVHGYHVWFSDGQHYLELWQAQMGYYQIQRFVGAQVQMRQVSLTRSAQATVHLIENQLHFRDARVLDLQAAAYPKGEHLAGLPWLVHAHLTQLIGLKVPEWQLRTKWLLQFEGDDISREMNGQFWTVQATSALTPLVDNAALVATVATVWLQTLINAGHLAQTKTGWRWVKPLVWYPDAEHKLAALRPSES